MGTERRPGRSFPAWTGLLLARNQRIGDYELGATLSDVLGSLTHPVGDCGNRESDRFCELSPQDAFRLLKDGLFDSEPSLSQIIEQETWARFDVSISVDVFDDWRLYLIDCGHHSRLLVGKWCEISKTFAFVSEERLRVGEYDEVITKFQRELNEIWTKHQGS